MTAEPLAKDKCRWRRPGCRNHGSLDGGPLLVPKIVVSSKTGKEVIVWSCPDNCKTDQNEFFRQPFVTDVDIILLVKSGIVADTYYRFLRDATGFAVPPIRSNIAETTYHTPCCAVCQTPLSAKIAMKKSDGSEFPAWFCRGNCKTDSGDWVKHPFMKDVDLRELGDEYKKFIKFPKPSDIAVTKSNWNAVTDEFTTPVHTGVKRKADVWVEAAELQQQRDKEIEAVRASFQKRIDALVNDNINTQ
jgi:hypothetical protein